MATLMDLARGMRLVGADADDLRCGDCMGYRAFGRDGWGLTGDPEADARLDGYGLCMWAVDPELVGEEDGPCEGLLARLEEASDALDAMEEAAEAEAWECRLDALREDVA